MQHVLLDNVRPARTQISCISTQSDQSPLGVLMIVKNTRSLQGNSENSSQISQCITVKFRFYDHSKVRSHRNLDQLLPVPDAFFFLFYIAPDKREYLHNTFLFLHKKYVVGTE